MMRGIVHMFQVEKYPFKPGKRRFYVGPGNFAAGFHGCVYECLKAFLKQSRSEQSLCKRFPPGKSDPPVFAPVLPVAHYPGIKFRYADVISALRQGPRKTSLYAIVGAALAAFLPVKYQLRVLLPPGESDGFVGTGFKAKKIINAFGFFVQGFRERFDPFGVGTPEASEGTAF